MAVFGAGGGTRPEQQHARSTRGLSVYLSCFALAILVPLFSLGAATALHMAETYRTSYEQRLRDTARALASAIDAELGATIAAVETLAASPLLDDVAAFTQFYVQAERVANSFDTYVVVSTPYSPRQVLNTRFEFGGILPAMVAPDTVSAVLRSSRSAITDLRVPPALGQPVIAAIAPVLRVASDPTLAVVLPFRPARLAGLLQAQRPSAGAFAILVDGNAAIVARSADQERYVGRRMPDEFLSRMYEREGGTVESASFDGEQMIFGLQRLQKAPGWKVVVAEPAANHRRAWLVPLLGLAAGSAVAFALGIGLSALAAQRILRPVSALAQRAEATAQRGLSAPLAPLPPARVTEFRVLQSAVDRAEAALRESSARLGSAVRAARLGIFERHLPSGTASWDDRAREIFGGLSPQDCGASFDVWWQRVHPEDREAIAAATRQATVSGGQDTYEVTFRFLRKDGGWNWIASHGAVTEREHTAGRAIRVAGVVQDITDRKAAETRQQLLMRELDHRAKNALAVVQAALRLTPRDDLQNYARAVEGRVNALARAHGLLAENRWSSAGLRSLVNGELNVFVPSGGVQQTGSHAPLIEVSGPDLRLRPEAVQAVSMALHELATNAIKHGALSFGDGRVKLSWRIDAVMRALRMTWAEQGGPLISSPPLRYGFGTRVIETTIKHQLQGRVACHWHTAGLVCELDLPLDVLLDVHAAA